MNKIDENDSYILDLSSKAVDVENLIDFMLWETPTLLIPSRVEVSRLKCLLLKRYSLHKEDEIKNAIENCDIFLEE